MKFDDKTLNEVRVFCALNRKKYKTMLAFATQAILEKLAREKERD